eukprot:g13731.t1
MAAASCVGVGAFLQPSAQPMTELALRASMKQSAFAQSGSAESRGDSATRVLGTELIIEAKSCDDVMFLVRVQQHPRFKRSGDDLHIAVELGLADALLGKPVRLRHLDGRELKLRPKGLKPGIHVVQGEGMPKVDSNERGDLHLRLEVAFPNELDIGTMKELIAALQRRLDTAEAEAKSRL